jgi:hypothetical protein
MSHDNIRVIRDLAQLTGVAQDIDSQWGLGSHHIQPVCNVLR